MKQLLVLFFALVVISPVRAQDDDKFDFGLKLGVGFGFKNFRASLTILPHYMAPLVVYLAKFISILI